MLNGKDPELLIEMAPPPTHGFNINSFSTDDRDFYIWDCGGSSDYRLMWTFYYNNIDGVIFVLDAGDEGRLEESGQELVEVMTNDFLIKKPILILAHKIDLVGAISDEYLKEYLGIKEVTDRPIRLSQSTIFRYEDIESHLLWLIRNV